MTQTKTFGRGLIKTTATEFTRHATGDKPNWKLNLRVIYELPLVVMSGAWHCGS